MKASFLLSIIAIIALTTACHAFSFKKSSSVHLSKPIQHEAIRDTTYPVIPKQYPLYKQCDSQWGSNIMINETVCAVGCLMSSVSSAIAGWGIDIDGQVSTPGTLNQWLRTHNGYDSGDELEEDVIPNINSEITWLGAIRSSKTLSYGEIAAMISSKQIVIANVMNGRHFVLAIGYDDQGRIWVNDSGFDRQYYNFTDIVGWRFFSIFNGTPGL